MTAPKWHESPYVVEIVSILQYLVKALLKIYVGGAIASSMIKGDGFHNLGDIVPAMIVMGGMWLRRQKIDGFPFQLKEVESILTLVIGSIIGLTGLKIGFDSALGALSHAPALEGAIRSNIYLPTHEAVRIDPSWFLPLMALMTGSIVFSIGVSWFQTRVGKIAGEAALVADGKETLADCSVEVMALIGIILVQKFGLRLAEYVLGLVVMAFILHTAWEIIKPSMDTLLKKSLGKKIEVGIKENLLAIPGMVDVERLTTFRVGRSTAVCLLGVQTRLDGGRHEGLRKAAKAAVRRRLLEVEDVRETEIHLSIKGVPTMPMRIAYACETLGGRHRIVDDLSRADCLLIADMSQGDAAKSRIKAYRVEGETAAFARRKHARILFYRNGGELPTWAQGMTDPEIREAYSANPEVELGVPLYD